MFDVNSSWYKNAVRSSTKYKYRRPADPKNLRWCPGTYTDPVTGEKSYHDVWLKHFLHNRTPFDTFEELFEHVKFEFEKAEEENEQQQHGTSSTVPRRYTW